MDAVQFAAMMDLLRQTLTAVVQGAARPAGPDPRLQRPTKMTQKGNNTPWKLSGRGRQPIDIRLSVMAVTRRGWPIESITGAEALVESCGDGEPQKKKRATEQSISSSRGETLGSPVYER
ncbi:UNVERIFIED_CONTAM: hypothetical protein FKN15_038695 [Acipenser sinensis]